MTGALTDGLVDGVEYTVLGSGGPVTLFAHGLGGGRSETRPLAGRVSGTRVLLSFRGHGGSDALDGGWDYDVLAHDVALSTSFGFGGLDVSVVLST